MKSSPPPRPLAIAGLGRIAEIQIAALAGSPDFQLIAACDPDPARAVACPPNVAFFPDPAAMLASLPRAAAVVVSTPTLTHDETAAAVIAAGHHLLLEKPASARPGGTGRLHALATAAGVHLHTAFHMACGAETDWLAAQLVPAIAAGVRLHNFESRFHDPLYPDGILHPRAPSVLGSWVDSGINALSVLSRFADLTNLQRTSATFQQIPGLPVADVAATVTFAGPGLTGTIHTDWTAPTDQKTTLLHFSDGQIWSLDHHRETAAVLTPVSPESAAAPVQCQRHPDRMVDHYQHVFQDFAAALTHGRSNRRLSGALHRLLLGE